MQRFLENIRVKSRFLCCQFDPRTLAVLITLHTDFSQIVALEARQPVEWNRAEKSLLTSNFVLNSTSLRFAFYSPILTILFTSMSLK